MTEQPPPGPPAGPTTPTPATRLVDELVAPMMADPVVLSSAVLVALGLLLLILGVVGSWHWKAAIWGAVLASLAAFALVAISAQQRRTEFAGDAAVDASGQPSTAVPEAVPVAATTASDEVVAAPPRPRFSGFGKPKADGKPAGRAKLEAVARPAPPPPQPTNVQVMQVPGMAGNVRVAPTPQPMPISRPEKAAARPPSTPPSTPPTIQVGVPRTPGFPVHQPVDPDAPVIQVRNRYHRPDCRYVTVADDPVTTTVGAAKASNAMPCGVCRP